MKRRRRPKMRTADLLRAPVLAVRELPDAVALTVALTESQAILVRVGARDAVKDRAPECLESGFTVPMIDHEGQNALVLRVDDPPPGIVVGAMLDLRVRLGLDLAWDLPIVQADAVRIALSRLPRRAAPITLPSIGMPA